MKIKFNDVMEKVKEWGVKDWEDVNVNGKMEIVNKYGWVEMVLSKKDYFDGLESVKNFNELEDWFEMIMGEDLGEGFGCWLDKVLEE